MPARQVKIADVVTQVSGIELDISSLRDDLIELQQFKTAAESLLQSTGHSIMSQMSQQQQQQPQQQQQQPQQQLAPQIDPAKLMAAAIDDAFDKKFAAAATAFAVAQKENTPFFQKPIVIAITAAAVVCLVAGVTYYYTQKQFASLAAQNAELREAFEAFKAGNR